MEPGHGFARAKATLTNSTNERPWESAPIPDVEHLYECAIASGWHDEAITLEMICTGTKATKSIPQRGCVAVVTTTSGQTATVWTARKRMARFTIWKQSRVWHRRLSADSGKGCGSGGHSKQRISETLGITGTGQSPVRPLFGGTE